MKKRLTVLFATMLCACGLMLAACGGTAEEQGAAETNDAAQEEVASDAEEQAESEASDKFVGKWILAAMSSEGTTIVGDFQAMTGSEGDMTLVINGDGTATINFDDVSSDASWTMKDDDTLVLTDMKADDTDDDDRDDVDDDADDKDDDIDDDDDDKDDADDVDDESEADALVDDALDEGFFASGETLEAVFEDGHIVIFVDADGFSGNLIYSEDGTLKELPILTIADATDFKSSDQLMGDWSVAAMVTNGVTMYSDEGSFGAEDEGFDSSLVIDDTDVLQFMGMTLDWGIDGDGAFMSTDDERIPLKLLHGMLVVDMTEAYGSDTELLLAYKK